MLGHRDRAPAGAIGADQRPLVASRALGRAEVDAVEDLAVGRNRHRRGAAQRGVVVEGEEVFLVAGALPGRARREDGQERGDCRDAFHGVFL
jgi:hypothetical protein